MSEISHLLFYQHFDRLWRREAVHKEVLRSSAATLATRQHLEFFLVTTAFLRTYPAIDVCPIALEQLGTFRAIHTDSTVEDLAGKKCPTLGTDERLNLLSQSVVPAPNSKRDGFGEAPMGRPSSML